MSWLDIRFICLVKVERKSSGAEERGEDEIEFTIRKTKFKSVNSPAENKAK